MAYVLLFLTIFAIVTQVTAQVGTDYCQICAEHTLCLYNSTSPMCNRVMRIGVTDAEKTTILDEHNKYRDQVARGLETRGNPGPQPRAANMRVVRWDNEIASIAQMWVRQCEFNRDKCRNTNGTYVGQNLYLFATTVSDSTANWAGTIRAWYEEVTSFNRSHISPFRFNPDAGHYTQVVWAATVRVGCGYINYFTDPLYYHYYACNYEPGGNFIGSDMYGVGSPCSSCSGGCSAQYPDLCN